MNSPFNSRSLENDPHRHLKEFFGGVYFCWNRYGDTTLTEYLQDQLNFSYKLSKGSPYTIKFELGRIEYENEKVRIEYLHPSNSFLEPRIINEQLK